jgi:two-component system nitrate/nitrite response regulator NarL
VNTIPQLTEILVVEDHPMFREALIHAIDSRDDMTVIGETGSGREAIETLRSLRPQVCVLDLGLPDIDGVEVLKRVTAEEMETRVLVLSGECDSEVVYSLLEAGASGFERKTAGPSELVGAIAAVARGETVLPAELLGGLAEQIRGHRSPAGATLSDRELEILLEVAEGHSAAEIAANLHLAESTVKTHLTRIYDKLGVSERAAAVATALRRGVIE